MLKADLHLHAKEDKQDNIKYAAKELISIAAQKGFQVMAFTFHDDFFYPKEIIAYAKKKGIILLPGTELTLEGKHVLVHGIKQLPKITTIQEVETLKDQYVITAPHPYFPASYALGKKLEQHINLFHNIECTARYIKAINFNKKAIATAKKYNKPILAGSDCHELGYFGYTWSNIDARDNKEDILEALRKGKFTITTRPLPVLRFAWVGIKSVWKDYVIGQASDRI